MKHEKANPRAVQRTANKLERRIDAVIPEPPKPAKKVKKQRKTRKK